MFTHIAQQIAAVPAEVWVVLGGVLGLSSLQQILKHYVDGLSERTNMLITMALSGLLASSDYLTSAAASNPTVIGPETAAIVGLMTVAYRYIVKPFYNLLIDAQELRKSKAPAAPALTPAPAGVPGTLGVPAASAEDEFAG